MHPWVQVVLAVVLLGIGSAAVGALLALRRAALRAETVLGILGEEIRPLVAEAHGLIKDVQALARETNDEMERVGAVTERVRDIADGIGRMVTAVSGLSRAGKIVGVALGLKKGVDVFLHRLSRGQGDHHGQ